MSKFEKSTNLEFSDNPIFSVSEFLIGEDEYYYLKNNSNAIPIDQVSFITQFYTNNTLPTFGRWKELQIAQARDQILEGKVRICE